MRLGPFSGASPRCRPRGLFDPRGSSHPMPTGIDPGSVPRSPAPAEAIVRTGRRGPWFLLAVFLAIAAVVLGSYTVYLLQAPRSPPPDNLTFSHPLVSEGNASFAVQRTAGGPYSYDSFFVTLKVNNFASNATPLAPSETVMPVVIGPNRYRIVWSDSDVNDAVGVGDLFFVTGDGTPLYSLSVYELDLQWASEWTAKATWSTS